MSTTKPDPSYVSPLTTSYVYIHHDYTPSCPFDRWAQFNTHVENDYNNKIKYYANHKQMSQIITQPLCMASFDDEPN